jgi:hypothetical protein
MRHARLSMRSLVGVAVGGLMMAAGLTSAVVSAGAATGTSGSSGPTVERITKVGSVTLSELPPVSSAEQAFRQYARVTAESNRVTNRSLSPRPSATGTDQVGGLAPPVVAPTPVAQHSPGLQRSWEGVNANTETAAEGATFTPPDQGLCTGNGYVFEIVNNALRIYRASGAPASATVSTNQFFGLPPLFNPSTNKFGPEPTDPNCVYDSTTGRFFVDEVVLAVNPKTGNFTGQNAFTLAVSRTSDPLGAYNIYTIDVTDTHAGGMHIDCPCIGDFPHIATDRYGLYLTTNEYPFFSGAGFYGNGFNGAQLYAMSKAKLAAGALSTPVVHFSDTSLAAAGRRVPGFTVWPAQVPDAAYATTGNGSEYFVSSTAAMEANPTQFTGFGDSLGVYQLSNTVSLNTGSPRLVLDRSLLGSEVYGVAPLAQQRPGPTPLLDCLAVQCFSGVGPGNGVEGGLDPSDTRPLTVWYADGRIFTALDTVMQVKGNLQSGPAWFVIDPTGRPSSARMVSQGYLGVAGNNIIYPSVATTAAGDGVMDFTLVGDAYYPGQGYLHWGPTGPVTAISITVPANAPLDDFCQYNFYNCAGTPTPTARPRYGDYSMAAYSGGAVYIANEVVSSRCSFAAFKKDPTCGGTRSPFTNWSTRISVVTP